MTPIGLVLGNLSMSSLCQKSQASTRGTGSTRFAYCISQPPSPSSGTIGWDSGSTTLPELRQCAAAQAMQIVVQLELGLWLPALMGQLVCLLAVSSPTIHSCSSQLTRRWTWWILAVACPCSMLQICLQVVSVEYINEVENVRTFFFFSFTFSSIVENCKLFDWWFHNQFEIKLKWI